MGEKEFRKATAEHARLVNEQLGILEKTAATRVRLLECRMQGRNPDALRDLEGDLRRFEIARGKNELSLAKAVGLMIALSCAPEHKPPRIYRRRIGIGAKQPALL